MANKDNFNYDTMGTNRRTILKGAIMTGAGAVGLSQMSGFAQANRPASGGPCFKDFTCSSEEGTYVKFEFIIETDVDGNIIDCYFEEETDTGLIEIMDWESKNGEACEPISVTWESTTDDPTYVATSGLAFGGDDCDTIDDPASGSYTSGLTNNGGNTAAISNLQFC
ncbi:MAG: hypothetical protein ABEI86_02350, partial [Halobacteriaceae archaeon]